MKPSDVKLWIDPWLLDNQDYYEYHIKVALKILRDSVWYPETIVRVTNLNEANYLIIRYGSSLSFDLDKFRKDGGRVYYVFTTNEEVTEALHDLCPTSPYTWKWKYSDDNPGYEVTSRGDRRFSPLCMMLNSISIENWMKKCELKGKKRTEMWIYLLRNYLKQYPGLFYELAYIGRLLPFTDMFDKDGGQNMTYAMILNEYFFE